MNNLTYQEDKEVTALYIEHKSWLHRWLRNKLQCDELARDLVQSTFVRLLLKPETINELKQPRAYLTTIAHGLVNDHWRRQHVEQAYLEALALYPEELCPSEEHRAIALDTLMELVSLLANMKKPVHDAFILSQIEGLTYRQISDKLGVSERTIKTYMADAMLQCLRVKNAYS
ncbi:RNA polymerase, sigma-24 subunit, ECF subfamily [Methylophaga aminisulfidivorans MP]|uniref:RNA polymerase, sigma-24 subunit, ECF subfamily n=1 Tax=Methylophaga aminisulfidivorans MP TaxID=1026882 RepID=F5SX36_9GAMM|nr:sigma-70 family RNA polymerase sigma factor [Methylophaga aminisulfidivorans]EGL54929.1 RNA polymerase, sigma-24 subunit, ECF subfamily [Methylophaga aminisulfidivorans MP]